MSKKKLAGIIAACAAAITIAILLIHFEPWTGPPPVETYRLTTKVCPSGAGSISPPGGEYESGEQVTLTAYPAGNYTFDHWSDGASGNSTTITITMNHNYYICGDFASTASNPVTLVAPECGAMLMYTTNVGFSWTGQFVADEFYFVLSRNPDLSAPVVEAGLTVKYYKITVTLAYGTTYYWQVRALNGGSVISESNIEVFHTAEPCESG